MPARSQAFDHGVRKPSDVQGRPRVFVRMSGPRRSTLSSGTLRGRSGRLATRRRPLAWRRRMYGLSYADHGRRRRSPWLWPLHKARMSASRISLDEMERTVAVSCSLQILSLRSATYRRPPFSQGLIEMMPRSLVNHTPSTDHFVSGYGLMNQSTMVHKRPLAAGESASRWLQENS
jgi:hypothetical protein